MAYSDDEMAEFIALVERSHFRTEHDTGANKQAMLIWNVVRKFAGLPALSLADLPKYCACCRQYHEGAATQNIHGNSGVVR